jgi:hypothetical protein
MTSAKPLPGAKQWTSLRNLTLAPDLALALFDHFYEIELIFGPLGPETNVRALRKTIVRPDFEAFRDGL